MINLLSSKTRRNMMKLNLGFYLFLYTQKLKFITNSAKRSPILCSKIKYPKSYVVLSQ